MIVGDFKSLLLAKVNDIFNKLINENSYKLVYES
jgi:hypothetical protein